MHASVVPNLAATSMIEGAFFIPQVCANSYLCVKCIITENLASVPVAQAYFDIASLKRGLEGFQIRTLVVIWVDDLRLERFDRGGCFLGRHRVGQIHGDKGHINI